MLAKKIARPDRDSKLADSAVEHLLAVSLFQDLREHPEALEALSHLLEIRRYSTHERIIEEGATGTELFLLVEGSVNVFKSTSEGELYKVAHLEAAKHPFFGEGGLLDDEARSATIQAESPAACLVLSRAAFTAFGKSSPHWALPILLRIARAVMGRLRKSNTDLMLLYNALVDEIRGHRTSELRKAESGLGTRFG